MPTDLSEVKEVISTTSRHQEYVNKQLETGNWVLLEVKVVETALWQSKTGDQDGHLEKSHSTIYVIGKVK